MSFQSDAVNILRAEIGPSAPVFLRKCLEDLRKDPLAVTEADIEEIADRVYDGIRSMIDDATAFRARHRILQIPPNARELRRAKPRSLSGHTGDRLPELPLDPRAGEHVPPVIAGPAAAPGPAPSPPAPARPPDAGPPATPAAEPVDDRSRPVTGPAPQEGFGTGRLVVPSPGPAVAADPSLPAKTGTGTGSLAVPAGPLPAGKSAPEAGSAAPGDITALFSRMCTDGQKKSLPREVLAPEPALIRKAVETGAGPAPGEAVSDPVSSAAGLDPVTGSDNGYSGQGDAAEPNAESLTDAEFPAVPDDGDPGMPVLSLQERLRDTVARLEDDGDNLDLWWEAAALCARAGKYRDAAVACQKMLELGGETAATWHMLGDCYKKTGQYDDCDAAYARSLELEPQDPVVWLKRAKVLINRNRPDDALVCCDYSLNLDNTSMEAWHYKAFVLQKAKRPGEALEIYTYLRDADPSDEKAARQVTTIQRMLGQ
ncbi:MAG: tetratricopeptide repeat protein [Methanomicrobiales archaeon]|nr:tetratricopeptide repeat protein [Methanomicrobiales archaeon]